MSQKAIDSLKELGKKAALLSGAIHLLEWDQETLMPEEGAANRAEQLALLSSILHEMETAEVFKKGLEQAENEQLSDENKACLREWKRDYHKAVALPPAFVETFARTTSQALQIWKEAREKSDFSLFAPMLEKIVSLNRQKADYLGYQEKPYDALLDLFEPQATTANITTLFEALKKEIVPLLKAINSTKKVEQESVKGLFSQDAQLAFSRQVAEKMGFSFKKGRLDLSTHPFCTSLHPKDTRITTRIDENDPIGCLMGVIHETGHALYEEGLPEEWFGTPLGQALSMGMHESQSRFWETRIGQSRPFWKGFYPLLKKTFPKPLQNIDEETFYRSVNRVEPTFIRVEADEVTYPLHVILRFELEQALINDKLPVKEIPSLWNEKMAKYLEITPPNDRLGCLQDIHWSLGLMGYFPTYTLGNIYAATLFDAFKNEHPDWDKRLETTDLSFVNEWQNKAVHLHGRRYGSVELLEKISKRPFSAEPYTTYLKEKYKKIYPGISLS
jgi:carboxypeptidase Taq